MISLPFELPPTVQGGEKPTWNGDVFLVGAQRHRVLRYKTRASGWNDELTELHERETEGGSHFIDRASRARAIAAVKKFLPECTHPEIMEVGVSGGHLLGDLIRHFPEALVIGADYTSRTLEAIAATFKGTPLIQMDLTDSPFPSNQFDGIVLLNVLEHIEHDNVAVAHCFRMLKRGGILVVEVPAGPNLYDDYDRELMHFRRYRRKDLVKLATDAHFCVEEASHIGFLLFIPFWLSKKLNRLRRTKPSDSKTRVQEAIRSSSRFSFVGNFLMKVESWLSYFVALPFGIRCTAVCRKPSG